MAKAKKKVPMFRTVNVALRGYLDTLDEMAVDDAVDGSRPDRSALLRKLIKEEKMRRENDRARDFAGRRVVGNGGP
jgi:hypothetical protein